DGKGIVDTPVEISFLEFRLPDVVFSLVTKTRHAARHFSSEVEIKMEMDITDAPIILGIMCGRGEIPGPVTRLKNAASALNEYTRDKNGFRVHPRSGEVIHLADVVFVDFRLALDGLVGRQGRKSGDNP